MAPPTPELWLPHPTFSRYSISSKGRVKGIHGEIMKTPLRKGYPSLSLMVEGSLSTNRDVHRLVAETFIPNPDGYATVDHINRKKTDNRVENLRWASHSMQGYNKDGFSLLYPRGVQMVAGTGRFKATIRLDKHQTYLGTFDTIEDAEAMYKAVSEGLGLVPESEPLVL